MSTPGQDLAGDEVHRRRGHEVTWFSVERPVAGGTVFQKPAVVQADNSTTLE
jgi:hypothetical protein